eukprot:4135855-Pleurochrysis_carterae.AAC.3
MFRPPRRRPPAPRGSWPAQLPPPLRTQTTPPPAWTAWASSSARAALAPSSVRSAAVAEPRSSAARTVTGHASDTSHATMSLPSPRRNAYLPTPSTPLASVALRQPPPRRAPGTSPVAPAARPRSSIAAPRQRRAAAASPLALVLPAAAAAIGPRLCGARRRLVAAQARIRPEAPSSTRATPVQFWTGVPDQGTRPPPVDASALRRLLAHLCDGRP